MYTDRIDKDQSPTCVQGTSELGLQTVDQEIMFYPNQVSTASGESALGSETFLAELSPDYTYPLPRTGTTGAEMVSMFAFENVDGFPMDNFHPQENWVLQQADMVPTSGPLMTPTSESSLSYVSESENAAHWRDSVSIEDFSAHLPMFTPVQSTGLKHPHWCDSTGSSASPRSLPSVDDVDSCPSEMVLPALDMDSSVYEPSAISSAVSEYNAPWNSSNSFSQATSGEQIMVSCEPTQVQAPTRSMEETPRRYSNDSDPFTARSDPRYKQGTAADGLYHCPIDGCSHRPEKLKCNYDKHLDSHLKPYRCKVADCHEVAFSSTACVLRHEREAHGMHGHGNRPYSCHFANCDRAHPENGFPRRWNLHDHMRRVHHYDPKPEKKAAGSGNAGRGASMPTPPESPELPAAGPSGRVTKRSSRISPKPRQSKDDTIKASIIRKGAARSGIPKAWVDPSSAAAAPQLAAAALYQDPFAQGHAMDSYIWAPVS